MGPGHADESAGFGLPHAGHHRVDAHAGVDEHRHGTAAHHGVAERQEIRPWGDKHDHAFGCLQASRHQAVFVRINAGGKRSEIKRVVPWGVAPPRETDLRHCRHPRHRRRRRPQRLVESTSCETACGRWRGTLLACGRLDAGIFGGGGAAEKCADLRDRAGRRIFQHEVGGVRDLHHLGRRKVGGDLAEDSWMEAGILHAPDDLHGRVGQGRQPGHRVVHQPSGCMRPRERNVADKAPDRLTARAGAVGMEVSPLDLVGKGVHRAERRQQFYKPHGVLREQPADDRGRRAADHAGE